MRTWKRDDADGRQRVNDTREREFPVPESWKMCAMQEKSRGIKADESF